MSAKTLTPLEQRCGRQRADLSVIADAAALSCPQCGCVYLDFPDGRDAHQVVFGHRPEVEA